MGRLGGRILLLAVALAAPAWAADPVPGLWPVSGGAAPEVLPAGGFEPAAGPAGTDLGLFSPTNPLTASTAGRKVSDGLAATFQALGASSGVPDGVGVQAYSARPVGGQPGADFRQIVGQGGLTLPVYENSSSGLFATGSVHGLGFQTAAVLPDSRVSFPSQLLDIQVGGVYLHKLADGRAWGVALTGGSASDKPFHAARELARTAFAFYRTPAGDTDAWLYYVVSSTTGQVGHNIPIPGVAYEFTREKLRGVVGFPFVNLTYQPAPPVEATFYFAPLTDVLARLSYRAAPGVKTYAGFNWVNYGFLRADRENRRDQFFWYEKRLETGVCWTPGKWVSGQVATGYAFDRYFVENSGFTITGRNRVDVLPGPYLTAQLLFQY